MKNRGYFTLELIVVLGLVTLVLSTYIGIISINLRGENLIRSYSKNEKNYIKNFEYILEEISRGRNIKCSNNRLTYIINQEGKEINLAYYFSKNKLIRDSIQGKIDIFLDEIEGRFSLKDKLLRMKFIYQDREEEYIYYVK